MAITGIPIVLSPNGKPITPVQSGAPLLTVTGNGLGYPVTIAENATPFIVDGLAPRPLGPLDYASYELGAFDNFSRDFDLASSSAVFGMVAYYTGDPVISIAHGGEPLTIIHQERRSGVLVSIIAAGTGLTMESAPLTINVTGGSVGGGAIRLNEMIDIEPELSGWVAGQNGSGSNIPTQTMTGTEGGTVKIAYGARVNDPNKRMGVQGASASWEGYLTTGTKSLTDFGPTGDWDLGAGWSWDGDALVHTGASSPAKIPYIYEAPGRGVTVHAFAQLESGSVITMSPSSSVSGNAVAGPLNHNVYGPMSANTSTEPTEALCTITVRGDARLTDIGAMSDAHLVSWVFASAPAVNGGTLSFSTPASPQWAITSAEILGQDYET